MTNSSRIIEVTQKLNKMFKGQTSERKDEIVKGLKAWCKSNQNTDDKGKLDAINAFLADNGVY